MVKTTTENQQAIINDVMEVKIGVYLYKIKQIELITAKNTPSPNNFSVMVS